MGISNLKATPGNGSLALTWTILPSNDNAIIVKWRTKTSSLPNSSSYPGSTVLPGTTGLTPWVSASSVELPISATSYTITGLINNRSYDVQVSSVHFSNSAQVIASPLFPPPPKLRIAVVGVAQRESYIPGIAKQFKDAGVHWDRDDVGSGDLTRVRQNLALGFKSIVLYNPSAGLSPGMYAAQVQILASQMLPLGLTEIEFINEPHLNGWTPQAYAAAYAAAHDAIKGMGITLIAFATGDYITSANTWSSDAGGKGWIHDFVAALPGGIFGATIVDAWSCHPYGALKGTGTDDSGWDSVANHRAYAIKYGSTAPWYVTEVGQRLSEVSLAGQAAAVTQYLNDLVTRYPFVVFWSWYEAIDDTTGQWGLVEADGSPRPSFYALKAWIAAHKSILG